MPPNSSPPRSASGGGLNRKVGPLPLKIWLLAAALLVVGYLVLRHPSSSSAASNAGDSASQLPGSTSDSTGQSGSPSDAATADLLAALGNDNQVLLQGLLSQSQLFYGGGTQFVPGSATGAQDNGSTRSIAALTGLTGNPSSGFEGGFYPGVGSSSSSGGGSNFEGSVPQVSPNLPSTTGTPTPGHNVAA